MCWSEKGTCKVVKNFVSRKCEGNIGERVELEEMLCGEVEQVRKFTCLDDSVSAGEECEAAVTARTKCGLVKVRECGELLYVKRCPLRL